MLGKRAVLSHGTLFVAASFTSINYEDLSILGRPTQSSIIILFISGLLLYLLPELGTSFSSSGRAQPLGDSSLPSSKLWVSVRSFLPQLRNSTVMPVALALCVRIEAFRLISTNRQCSISGIEGCLPLMVVICDYWYIQRRRLTSDHVSHQYEPVDPWSEALDHDTKYFLPSVCFTIASALSTYSIASPRSTYICPAASHGIWLIPVLQATGLILDCYIILAFAAIAGEAYEPTTPSDRSYAVRTSAQIFLSASVIMFIGSFIALITHPMWWQWVFNIDYSFISGVIWATVFFTVAAIAWIHVLADFGALHSTMFLTYISIYFPALAYAWSSRYILPHTSYLLIILCPLFLFLGAARTLHIQTISGSFGKWRPSQRLVSWLPSSSLTILLVSTLLLAISLYPSSEMLDMHPIETLMRDAVGQSHKWLEQASRSSNLNQATHIYQQRYGRLPPPGFDAWYQFATQKSSMVIDDYNSMYDDLMPFWGLSPHEIRLRTQQVISDPWNDVAGIYVRNGDADVGPDFKPTHRWMVEGILSMMEDFTFYLPEMDLAFNLNDEPRVAVPFSAMQALLKRGAPPKEVPRVDIKHQWSSNRARTWQKHENFKPSRPLTSYPRINSFSAATVNCPPNSTVWKSHAWDPSKLCVSCAKRHSQGAFVKDWPLSTSPCHQPDLRNLHGFYLSPAAFKTSHTILPIFSQSKVAGFADILYPSPWNYINKARYSPSVSHPDPSFSKKDVSLIWRGGTSEGVSRHGTWKGMTRQRLVHLANNLTNSTLSTLPMLLPHPSKEGKYTYQSTADPITALNLPLNISFVNEYDRAWDNDGPAQEAEFALGQPIDFQDHWRHRYLMDMDGAGFSGRFLPFLQSRSLPFRAGIFRTWYDSRLTAWAHFVPIDVRLHGLLSTLAYFTGTKGVPGAKTLKARVGVEARVAAGEAIAEAGRERAEKVLRKEDMEVYMFRLLLEWGRLTDDRRDEIGFVVAEGEGEQEESVVDGS